MRHSFSRCSRTCACNSGQKKCQMEEDSVGHKYSNQSMASGFCGKTEYGLVDPAILYVGKVEDKPKVKKKMSNGKYYRTSIPFSSKLLENSFNRFHVTNSQRKSNQSSDSYAESEIEEAEKPDEEERESVLSFLDREYGRKRHWELTVLGHELLRRPKYGFEFSVMSYNVLAQNLLEDNMFLYSESDRVNLDWKNRSEKLLWELKALNAEIICLQEVNESHYKEFFEPELKQLGYHGVYLKRTGDKLDGCATFYKTDNFSLVESVSVPYYKSNYNLLDRDNVGLIVKLRPHKNHCSDDDLLCVANTHLLFNPRRGDIKLAQVMCLFAELNKVAKTQQNKLCQVIVCGDFNATPFSDLYKFLVQGFLRYEGLLTRAISGQREGRYGKDRFLEKNFFPSEYNISDQCEYIHPEDKQNLHKDDSRLGHHSSHLVSQSSGCLWHGLNLVSTYRHTIERLGHSERDVTTQHGADSCTVDYIFYGVLNRQVHTRRNRHVTNYISEGKLKLLGRWGLMSSDEISELGNLPNHHHPSDHLPLLVKMVLT